MARNNSPPKTFPKKIDKYDRHPERINEIFNEKRVVTEIIANFMNMFLQTNFNSNRPYYQNSQNRFSSNDHFFFANHRFRAKLVRFQEKTVQYLQFEPERPSKS